ncbi:hypothetical protein [Rhodococcus spelaei]|uniref:hypothetical protein n=1 Tax=Rhodococcus spelaei TaxID=2546320 RepID=UPI0015EFAA0F|nr:hypothetical protein [Rhodococcus spelaei]
MITERDTPEVAQTWFQGLNPEFDSRHGDGFTLWAVYERPGDTAVSSYVTPFDLVWVEG